MVFYRISNETGPGKARQRSAAVHLVRYDMKSNLIHFLILSLLAVIFLFPALRDISYWGIHDWDVHIMDHAVTRDSMVVYRQFPLWNPYKGGGCPALGHARSICLSPLFIFLVLSGPVVGLKLMMVACMAIGLIGTFKLARDWEISPAGAYLAAFIFMFSSHFALKIAEGTTEYYGQCWLPWMIFFAGRMIRRPAQWIRYGIWTAFSFALLIFQGGGNDPVYNLIFLTVFLLVRAVQLREIRVLRGWGMIIAVTLIVSAIKILPLMETNRSIWRLTYAKEFQPETRAACAFAFLGRDQKLESPRREAKLQDRGIWNWEDHGCYVGYGSLLLAVIGLVTWRKRRVLMGVLLIVFIFLFMGHLAPIDIWSGLHKLPLFRHMRIPTRSGYCLALLIALLAGYGMTRIQSGLHRWGRWRALAGAIPILILLDLTLVSRLILDKVYFRPPERHRPGPFTQVVRPVIRGSRETVYSYSRLYPKYLQNLGEIDAYSNVSMVRNALPEDSPRYRGECWLVKNGPDSSCELYSFSPNAARLRVFSDQDDRLVFNQNYFSGWKISGLPGARVEMYRGKISLRIPPGRHDLKLYYLPRTFIWGLAITLAAIAASAFFLAGILSPRWFPGIVAILFVTFSIYAAAGIQSAPEIEWVRNALRYEHYGDREGQLESLRRAISHYPDSVEIREMLHSILAERLEEGDRRVLKEMTENLERLTELRPNNPEHHTNLGNAYREQGLKEPARERYRRALGVRPGYPPARAELKNIGK
jgi:tetratricopeptide (TPR) repeat protein